MFELYATQMMRSPIWRFETILTCTAVAQLCIGETQVAHLCNSCAEDDVGILWLPVQVLGKCPQMLRLYLDISRIIKVSPK